MKQIIVELGTAYGLSDLVPILDWWNHKPRRPIRSLVDSRERLIAKELKARERAIVGISGNIPPFTIVIDNREQRPLPFHGLATIGGTLATGDYSLLGFESEIAIERKSHGDSWNCVAGERDRFVRCLERLAMLDRAAIVIECNLAEFCERPEKVQRVTPATAVGSYISWSVQYGIPVFWADSRAYAERLIVRYLVSWLRHRRTE